MSKLIPHKSRDSAAQGSETALDLIYNFLNEPALSEMSKLAAGGTFPIKDFHLAKGAFGKQFWFCYDASQKKSSQRVFLALESSWKGWSRKMKLKDLPTVPESEKLLKPAAPFEFDDKNYDRTDRDSVDRFIHAHIDGPKSSKAIGRKDVQKLSKAFVSAFGGKGKKEYCSIPLAHLENFEPESKKLHIDDFLGQGDAQYVRYFFGLDKTKAHKVNRIRVVLFPVGAEKQKLKLTASGSTVSALEESWPPPPFN